MTIDRQEIDKLAGLARLEIGPEEAEEVARRIAEVLALIDRMREADTEAVEPMAYPLEATQRLRPDEPAEPDRRDELQALAPAVRDGLYLVPKVVE